jgi:hypothetical protein
MKLHVPHLGMPHVGRRTSDAPDGEHEHHHRPAFQVLKRVEGSIDLLIIALVVILALAMIYGLVTASTPDYFNR